MKIGLVGLPQTGKTTLFSLLTDDMEKLNSQELGKMDANIGTAKIPDKRIDFLSNIYNPRKTIYSTIEAIDMKGIVPENSTKRSSGAVQFLEAVRQVDALVHVVRAFENEQVAHLEGEIDPLRDIETINLELLFADLAVIENRIERIEGGKKVRKEEAFELEVLKKCREGLEKGSLINSLELSQEEKLLLKTFNFLTERPLIILVNMDENQFRAGEYKNNTEVRNYTEKNEIPLMEICVKTELEINQLEDEDRKMFMDDLGISETGVGKLASVCYDYLGLISFFTVGEDEVRAWPIKKGIKAKSAAGKVHSDIERGFIRAEVVAYDDMEANGSVQKLREKGLYRLEGKEYIVKDGDIINFRFNI